MEELSLSGHLEEEEGVGEEECAVVEEEEVTMLHVTMKLSKMEETMDTTMLLLHRIVSMVMEVWSLRGHMVEEEGVAEEEDVVVVEEEVTMVPNLTMKLNTREETTDTTMVLLNMIMDMMVLLRDVDVAVEGEVVEEEEAVDSTDQMDHRFRQLLK